VPSDALPACRTAGSAAYQTRRPRIAGPIRQVHVFIDHDEALVEAAERLERVARIMNAAPQAPTNLHATSTYDGAGAPCRA
jgi:hypothetical protein